MKQAKTQKTQARKPTQDAGRNVLRALTLLSGATVKRQRGSLLVGYQRRNYLLGVSGTTEAGWTGHFQRVRTPGEALRALGVPARLARGVLQQVEEGTPRKGSGAASRTRLTGPRLAAVARALRAVRAADKAKAARKPRRGPGRPRKNEVLSVVTDGQTPLL